MLSFFIHQYFSRLGSRGEYQNESSFKLQVMSFSYLFAWKVLLQVSGNFLFFFIKPFISVGGFPQYSGISLIVTEITWDIYLGLVFNLIVFIELMLLSLLIALLSNDTSICRKNSWSATTYYGNFAELFAKLYILGDFIFDSSVNTLLIAVG